MLWLGLQKHSGDARASSFLKILELIPHTSTPPRMLFVENVVGFEVCVYSVFSTNHLYLFSIVSLLIVWCLLVQTSDTHTEMIDTLKKSDYVTQEFILSPLQFGVPYSRPRYFCLVLSFYLFIM